MVVNKANVDKYISKTAHEIAKRKTKNTKIAESDAEVVTIKTDLISCVSGGGPNVKVVVSTCISSHENRFCQWHLFRYNYQPFNTLVTIYSNTISYDFNL
jgi:hypothetical protein